MTSNESNTETLWSSDLHPGHTPCNNECLATLWLSTDRSSVPTEPHLESAERVLLGEVHRRDVVVEVALACAPEGLQLVPFGEDGVALVIQQRGCGQSAGRVDEVIRLGRSLGLLTEQTSYSANTTPQL